MKKIYFLFTIMIISQFGFTQTSPNLDSILNIWQDESQSDSLRFRALMDYPSKKWRWSKPDSTIYYGEIAYEFARKRNDKWPTHFSGLEHHMPYLVKLNNFWTT